MLFEGDADAEGATPSCSTMNFSARKARALFLASAELARRGDVNGRKHGCVLVMNCTKGGGPESIGDTRLNVTAVTRLGGQPANLLPWILGEGWNHRLDCSG